MATRDIELQNLETGTIDMCFDDSAVVSYTNFDFVKEGEVYDCKMELFGNFVEEKTDSSVEISIIKTNVLIGNTKYMEVMINSDVYYILGKNAKNLDQRKSAYYYFTRIDIIQVDNVIHADCL
jgi:TRAP-type C4-dicarboxylate transport system substrate-binding protein